VGELRRADAAVLGYGSPPTSEDAVNNDELPSQDERFLSG
jgi:hypothetical protein